VKPEHLASLSSRSQKEIFRDNGGGQRTYIIMIPALFRLGTPVLVPDFSEALLKFRNSTNGAQNSNSGFTRLSTLQSWQGIPIWRGRGSVANEPAEQLEQTELPAAAYLPAVQSRQVELPAGEYLPTEQVPQPEYPAPPTTGTGLKIRL